MSKKIEIPVERVQSKIYRIRKCDVLLDADLANLYGVETKQLKRAVRRNRNRFPNDFMFELTKEEFDNLRSKFSTSSWGGTRYPPMAFTEQGIAMLSSVLNSRQAIEVNIQIMRVFVKMREWVKDYQTLLRRIEKLEQQGEQQDQAMRKIYDLLTQFMKEKEKPKKQIGFKTSSD